MMIDFMRGQTINTKIPAALPPGVPVAHKTGELGDASSVLLSQRTRPAASTTLSNYHRIGDAVAELARPVRYGPAPPAGAAPKAILLLLAGTIFAVYTGPSGSQVWPAH
jgi:hypothetical protein